MVYRCTLLGSLSIQLKIIRSFRLRTIRSLSYFIVFSNYVITRNWESFESVARHLNLLPRVFSGPLFQSLSQKTTLAQGVTFEGVFSNTDNMFRGPECIPAFSLSFRHFVFLKDGKIFCHQLLLNFVRVEFRKKF